MAKGLRSKSKRAFRTAKRSTLAASEVTLEAERKKQEIMEQIVEQGKLQKAERQAAREAEAAVGPATMDTGEGGAVQVEDARQAMDGGERVSKKMRRQLRGKGKAKAGVSGMNQFHHKIKKGAKKRKEQRGVE